MSFEQFNQRIGLPKHPATNEPTAMAPFQLRFYTEIELARAEGWHKFHLNKSRQSGWSEEMLRIGAYESFRRYSGWACKLVAGTREKTTIKLMLRLKELFRDIPEVVENNSDKLYLELKNGTSWEGLPANPEASTGDTKIKAFLLDESAKWNLIEDMPVLNSIMPIVNSNKSDLFMFSTPKGPRGFFYNTEMEKNDFKKFKYNIWITEGYLYTREEILKMLADPIIDVQQEYMNQYTSGRNSIFGQEWTEGDYQAEVL